jgi:hypothetical protein
MYRTRDKSSIQETLSISNSVTNGPELSSVGFSIRPVVDSKTIGPFTRVYDKMWDNDHGFGEMNHCVHYNSSISTSLEEGSGVLVTCSHYTTANGWRQAFQAYIKTLGPYSQHPFLSPVIGNHSDPSHLSDWDVNPNLSGEAVTAMWPQVKSELSVINSILELKDFKHTPLLVKQTRKSLSSLLNFLTIQGLFPLNAKSSKLTLKQLVNTVTGQHLNYMFAVAPLVSDLRAIRRAMTNTRQKIANLLAYEDQILKSHWRRNLTIDDVDGFDGDTETNWSGGQFWHNHKSISRLVNGVDYVATMRYNYHFPKWIREHADVLGKLDAFGVNFNPTIIWNAIPFSFVIDWIANIGKAADSYKGRLLDPIVNIEGFCHSVSYDIRDEIWIYPYQSFVLLGEEDYQWSSSEVLSATRDRHIFVRRKTIPDFFTSVQMSGLSTTEISLAASLLGSVWSGHK